MPHTDDWNTNELRWLDNPTEVAPGIFTTLPQNRILQQKWEIPRKDVDGNIYQWDVEWRDVPTVQAQT